MPRIPLPPGYSIREDRHPTAPLVLYLDSLQVGLCRSPRREKLIEYAHQHALETAPVRSAGGSRRRDPKAARILLPLRVHPDTSRLIREAAAASGESAGQVVDRLAREGLNLLGFLTRCS